MRLALVFGILESAQNKFETIVFAMLVLIYIWVQGASQQESYLHLLAGAQRELLFKRVLLKLKYTELEWERDRRIQDERGTTEKLARIPVPYWITQFSFGMAFCDVQNCGSDTFLAFPILPRTRRSRYFHEVLTVSVARRHGHQHGPALPMAGGGHLEVYTPVSCQHANTGCPL